MKDIINIGIAEDHVLLRQGLVSLLREDESINILFEVNNGKELLNILKTTKPHIVLLDIEMPVMGGKEALERVKIKYPSIKIIIISAFFHKDYIIEFFKLGVCAFLPKDSKIDNVIEAIHSVYEQGGYFDNKISMILAKSIVDSNHTQPAQINLSGREIEVLKLICTDKSSKETADILCVTKSTIDFHRKNIMRKTGSKSFSSLVAYAIQLGFISS